MTGLTTTRGLPLAFSPNITTVQKLETDERLALCYLVKWVLLSTRAND